jgi:Homing endonuclease associated repeat/HNH endonuclease
MQISITYRHFFGEDLAMFKVQLHKRNITDDELIDDIRSVASKLGKSTLTENEYTQDGRFSVKPYRNRFGTWLNALEKAGLTKSANRKISDDDFFENLAKVWSDSGRQPAYNTLTRTSSKYSAKAYSNRFGSWNNALISFELWANEGILPEQAIKAKDQPLVRFTRDISWRLRARVLMRDGAMCQLCGASPQSGAKLHVDHVVPWSKGGSTTLENLRILCVQCNIGKGDLLPESEDNP